MAFLNEDTNELHLKIIYAGASGAGKTTNLQSIYKQTASEVATRFFDLHGVGRSSQYFDFLPLAYGETRAHALRLHLYTLPAHDLWPSLLLNLLWGADGLAFVIDSRVGFLGENERQFQRLKGLVQCANRSFADLPMVFQFNHRDATDAVDARALRSEFTRHGAGEVEAVAVQDVGVLETLDTLSERILGGMETPPNWQTRASLGLQ